MKDGDGWELAGERDENEKGRWMGSGAENKNRLSVRGCERRADGRDVGWVVS